MGLVQSRDSQFVADEPGEHVLHLARVLAEAGHVSHAAADDADVGGRAVRGQLLQRRLTRRRHRQLKKQHHT